VSVTIGFASADFFFDRLLSRAGVISLTLGASAFFFAFGVAALVTFSALGAAFFAGFFAGAFFFVGDFFAALGSFFAFDFLPLETFSTPSP
jgi:hypothetical protein